jgi:arylsulfatase A-like enzyme
MVDPDLTTLTEMLVEQQYSCSVVAPYEKIGPKPGVTPGVHRASYRPTSWDDRNDDASDIVDTAIKYTSRDARASSRVFGFLHIFDCHFPYLPPSEDVEEGLDFELVDQYFEATHGENYIEMLRNPSHFPDEDLDVIKQYYRLSIRHVARELVRFIDSLKRHGIFEDALIIVTGDHGEDFLEHGFGLHYSLYDTNIRPGMVIKPPSTATWSVPDAVDTIDFLPTVAELVGSDPPAECVGQPLQRREDRPRITERFGSNWYGVAVERGETKAIYTYDYDYPNRPDAASLDDRLETVEYFTLDGNGARERSVTPDTETTDSLRELAESHIRSDAVSTSVETTTVDPDIQDRLEQLGYK